MYGLKLHAVDVVAHDAGLKHDFLVFHVLLCIHVICKLHAVALTFHVHETLRESV